MGTPFSKQHLVKTTYYTVFYLASVLPALYLLKNSIRLFDDCVCMFQPDYYRDSPQFKQVTGGAGAQYTLEIPQVKLDFTGTYCVIARNTHGEAKAIISLQIYAKGSLFEYIYTWKLHFILCIQEYFVKPISNYIFCVLYKESRISPKLFLIYGNNLELSFINRFKESNQTWKIF